VTKTKTNVLIFIGWALVAIPLAYIMSWVVQRFDSSSILGLVIVAQYLFILLFAGVFYHYARRLIKWVTEIKS
jgi:hypothetical protein